MKTRVSSYLPGALHHIALDDEPDLMSTPPISPMVGRSGRLATSYFDTPEVRRAENAGEVDHGQANLFSTFLNKAFETMSKTGEAMDVHGRDYIDLNAGRRAAKGKERAPPYIALTEPSSTTSNPKSHPAPGIEASMNPARQTSTAIATPRRDLESEDFYASHPFEAGLLDVLEATEKKVGDWWSWLSQEQASTTAETITTKHE